MPAWQLEESKKTKPLIVLVSVFVFAFVSLFVLVFVSVFYYTDFLSTSACLAQLSQTEKKQENQAIDSKF